MNIVILGAAGFIGTNLTLKLSENKNNHLTLVDREDSFFDTIRSYKLNNVDYKIASFDRDTDFESFLTGQDILYHLVSTTVPTTSNRHISQELESNVIFSSKLFEACVHCGVKKVVFISSGGTVYGKEGNCPLNEKTPTNPISAYGVQKITIEKLLYLYQYIYGLDYRVIRLANPYGPFQRPDGVLGAVTTFTYKALTKQQIEVFGDGSVVRDFIYIDDAIRAIINISNGDCKHRVFNVGSGFGTSINDILHVIEKVLDTKLDVVYKPGRKLDVPTNYLDISRYEKYYGPLNPINLSDGILKAAKFMATQYDL